MDIDDSKEQVREAKCHHAGGFMECGDGCCQSIDLYQQLLARIEDALWITTLNINPRTIYANPGFSRVWGSSIADIGQQWQDFLLPEDKDGVVADYCKFLTQDVRFHFEYRIVRPDGEIRWIAASAEKINIESQQLVLNIARDITGQKLAQLQYQAISQSAQDSIFCKDRDSKYTFVNVAMATLLQLPIAEIVGKTPEQIFPASEAAIIAELDASNFAGNIVDAVRDLRLGEQLVTLHTIQVPLRDEKGKIHGISGIVRNISEQKRVAEQLQHMQKMEAIGRLAGGIAHDFNNQLQGMMGYAGLLCEELEDPELRQDSEMILQATRRCAELTRQLLTFARKGSHIASVIDIHSVIKDVILLLQHNVHNPINIEQLLQATSVTVNGDATQLQNALLNLGLNASEAMPEGGKLIFSTALVTLDETYCQKYSQQVAAGNYVRVGVSDTGIGMAQEVQQRIFEPFFTTKKKQQYSGMGLATVYGIVKNHGGIIRVCSEINHGTTFDIYLPVTELPIEPRKKKAPAPNKIGACILVVDDEELVRNVASKMLGKLGYQVVCCNDGLQATDYYREHAGNIDLVILDMIMPGLNGKEAFTAMRTINPQVRILLASGYSIDVDTEAMMTQGLQGFISKPFRLESLAEMVAEALS